jgi:hypothetical protein
MPAITSIAGPTAALWHLRKNEGVNIDVRDILPDKDRAYVRKGKGYKER